MNKDVYNIIDYNIESLGGLQEVLEVKYYELIETDRRKKEFKELRDEYNKIVKVYNSRFKSLRGSDKGDIYSIIK